MLTSRRLPPRPSKQALWAAGYHYVGHTEMLQTLTGSPYSLTMFQVRSMRIFFLTRHLSLRDAIAHVTAANVLTMLDRVQHELAGIGLQCPRIALAALNPHAGEGGALGTEEQEHPQPAVAEAQRRGINVSGPVPADSVFAEALQDRYDAVLALYHVRHDGLYAGRRLGGGVHRRRSRHHRGLVPLLLVGDWAVLRLDSAAA